AIEPLPAGIGSVHPSLESRPPAIVWPEPRSWIVTLCLQAVAEPGTSHPSAALQPTLEVSQKASLPPQPPPFRGGRLAESKLILFDRHEDGSLVMELASQNFLCERVFQVALHGPAHGARTVGGIVSLLHQEVLSFLVERQPNVLGFESVHDLVDL